MSMLIHDHRRHLCPITPGPVRKNDRVRTDVGIIELEQFQWDAPPSDMVEKIQKAKPKRESLPDEIDRLYPDSVAMPVPAAPETQA